jgi:hypothetical protein
MAEQTKTGRGAPTLGCQPPSSNGTEPASSAACPNAATADHTSGASDAGKNKRPWRVFAFGAGGLDAAVQLGTIHALLVTGEKADVVLGISAGAASAVALGEILKIAPETAALTGSSGAAKDAAAVSRFLEVLEAYREVPTELFRTIQPDPYEVTTGDALAPLELPIHFKDERTARCESLREKRGLIAFLNGLLDVRVRVKTLARFMRLLLDLTAAEDTPNHWWCRTKQSLIGMRLWLEMILAFSPLGRTVGLCLWALLIGFRGFGPPGVQAKRFIFSRHWGASIKRALPRFAWKPLS